MKRIECVIFDWAGTTVDYGCFAPVAAFVESFEAIGVPVTPEETRRFMGLTKVEEIRALFGLPRVAEAFQAKYGREAGEADVQGRYKAFQEILYQTLDRYASPIPGVVDTVNRLRAQGIKIGSTTGYTETMMDIVRPAAEAQGYRPDCCVTSDHLPAGRPAPYMMWQNLTQLAVPSTDAVVKVGDTIADIGEGLSAKVWTVGVVMGSNELALSQAEVENMSAAELEARKAEVRRRMTEAGAHYVIDHIGELSEVIAAIEQRS